MNTLLSRLRQVFRRQASVWCATAALGAVAFFGKYATDGFTLGVVGTIVSLVCVGLVLWLLRPERIRSVRICGRGLAQDHSVSGWEKIVRWAVFLTMLVPLCWGDMYLIREVFPVFWTTNGQK